MPLTAAKRTCVHTRPALLLLERLLLQLLLRRKQLLRRGGHSCVLLLLLQRHLRGDQAIGLRQGGGGRGAGGAVRREKHISGQ